MTPPLADEFGEVTPLYALLDDIDRAGHIRGTSSWLVWLRLKTATGRSSAKAYARALHRLLAEIHGLGLIAGTDAHGRWQLLKAGLKLGAAVAPAGRFPRCDATFLFWRGRQMQRVAASDSRPHHAPDGT